MQLTAAQLAEVKSYLESGKRILVWMNDNELGRQDIKPRDIVNQLKEEFGEDAIKDAIKIMQTANYGMQITRMASRMIERDGVTTKQLDGLIGRLQDALVLAQAKKAELEG